ncbi:CRISPR-associated endoribonuclease Cas6 [Fulvivirga sediminis]|uniref:CRISPR-associated endoribonuclease n=1 Tax=Fulvivirga sediminis TaxID=2803949 RepID=A0A937K064_9BACT|nr:CRISPR-associated endoribonuclease Cas6 [Fulvivirga sediminis]MBL3656005.1 CRISPR-associated endoribonuclease Cas6 [Fulvivirga sediminis]
MRLRITLKSESDNCQLPINYQYVVHSWIYSVLQKADAEFSQFLHDDGYRDRGKAFKFFHFSNLTGLPYQVKGDRIIFDTDYLHLTVGFLLPDAMQKFILGLFYKQRLVLGDKKSSATFKVEEVQLLARPHFQTTMNYRAQTPLVISKKEVTDRYAQYLSPEDGRYEMCFINHMLQKYKIAVPQLVDEVSAEVDDFIAMQWKLQSAPRKKGVTIKEGTPQETQIIGYVYDFEFTAPPKIHQMAYDAGFGEKNSLGFGFCEARN